MLAAIGESLHNFGESLGNALKERQPIVLANGHKTSDYQVWRVALGHKVPGVPREFLTTRPIVAAELAEDCHGSVVYKKIQEMSPARLFPIEYYYLEYRLPKAPFHVRVHLDNPGEVKRCFSALGSLSHARLMRLAASASDGLRLVPRQGEGYPIFNFEPEDLVKVVGGEMKTGPALTAFLADLYLAGRITAADFDHVMHQSSTDMRQETFTLIPAREQPKHEYLKRPARPKKLVPPEDRYHLGTVTLPEYANLKRPDLAAELGKLQVAWPRPERTFVCVVCGVDQATIRCMECENRCCGACLKREFTGFPSADAGPTQPPLPAQPHAHSGEAPPPQTFLLLHHIYCLKNGRPSVAFLRGLRQHRRKPSRPKKLRPLK